MNFVHRNKWGALLISIIMLVSFPMSVLLADGKVEFSTKDGERDDYIVTVKLSGFKKDEIAILHVDFDSEVFLSVDSSQGIELLTSKDTDERYAEFKVTGKKGKINGSYVFSYSTMSSSDVDVYLKEVIKPAGPTEPTKPSEPTKPTEPTKPSDPTKPTAPTNQTEASKASESTTASATSGTSASAQTTQTTAAPAATTASQLEVTSTQAPAETTAAPETSSSEETTAAPTEETTVTEAATSTETSEETSLETTESSETSMDETSETTTEAPTEAALLVTKNDSDPSENSSEVVTIGTESSSPEKEKTYVDASKKSGGMNPLLIGLVVVVLLAAGGYVLWIVLMKRKKEKEKEPEGPAPVVMNGYLQKPTVGVAAAKAIRPIRSNVAAPSTPRAEKTPSESADDNAIPEMEKMQEELQKKMDELSKEMEELPDLDSVFPEEGPKE